MPESADYVTSVDPEAFARSVAETADEHLAEGLRGPLRETILGEIFRRMEEHYRPEENPEDGARSVIRFRIGGRPDGGYDRFDVTIGGGECSVSPEPGDAKPRITITVGDVEFLKLATGNAKGPELFLRRKLKIKGDLLFAPALPGLFTIPRAGS